MASLVDRNGTYYAQFYDSSRSPSRKRLSLQTKRKRKARRKLTELEDALEDGSFDPWSGDGPYDYRETNANLTLREAFEGYCEEKRKEGIKESTLRAYGGSWRGLFERYGEETELSELTADQIGAFVHDPEIADSTRHKRFRHVRCVLRFFDCEGVLEDVSKPQRPDSLPTPVRKDDLSALTEALKEDYREKRRNGHIQPLQKIWQLPLWRFAFYSGLRVSEVARLRWEDIDREAGVIRLKRQKNGTENATVPLVSKAVEALENTPKPREPKMYVFRYPYGNKYDRSATTFRHNVSEAFTEIRKKADVSEDFTFHDLRAGFATALANAGMSAHQIRDAMRHADINTSLKYVKVSNQRLRNDMEQAFA